MGWWSGRVGGGGGWSRGREGGKRYRGGCRMKGERAARGMSGGVGKSGPLGVGHSQGGVGMGRGE